MKKEVQVIEKPAEISWDSIHEILLAAHSDKNKVGDAQTSAYLSGDELEKVVGDGKCFIALVDNKIAGTASVNIRERNFWYNRGELITVWMLSCLIVKDSVSTQSWMLPEMSLLRCQV